MVPFDIRKAHDELFDLLIAHHFEDSNFMFTFRRSNRGARLERGFWFYGNEQYLAVSFWSGFDWKNRTPNISFIINNEGRTFLEISASDSDLKKEFIERVFFSNSKLISDLNPTTKGYQKEYIRFSDNYFHSLQQFILYDKVYIDEMLEMDREVTDSLANNEIGFIDQNDFQECFEKVQRYKFPTAQTVEENYNGSLQGFHIRNFGPIEDSTFIEIPRNNRWVFLTGENGTGKTSILKAIASGICHTKAVEEDFYIKLEFEATDSDHIPRSSSYERRGNRDIRKRNPKTPGFCAYGASRLKTTHSNSRGFSLKKALSKNGLVSSLFDSDTILIDIQYQFDIWRRNPVEAVKYEKRKNYIKEILIDLLPNVYEIDFPNADEWRETIYVEKDNERNRLNPVAFDKLASGLKSLIAMFGDMMVRLFNQQPDVYDPSELKGIVIIDEIDIHLHPKLQKKIVEQLYNTFPNIQFLVTTHSPIPLLGAPNASIFFKVKRNVESGVEIVDLSEIKANRLLPNAILTSDLFDMDQLFSRESIGYEDIRTESTFEEIELNDKIKEELKAIARRLNNDDQK